MKASDWNRRWREKEIPWDHGEAAPPFREWIERGGRLMGRGMVPGCGSGHDVRFLAECGLEVIGMDISDVAIATARQKNSHPRAQFRVGDWLDRRPLPFGPFDWIAEHTCLCAIDTDRRTDYRDSVIRNLVSGGIFLAILYINPASGGGPPFPISEESAKDLFEPALELKQSYIPQKAWPNRAGRERVVRFIKKST